MSRCTTVLRLGFVATIIVSCRVSIVPPLEVPALSLCVLSGYMENEKL